MKTKTSESFYEEGYIYSYCPYCNTTQGAGDNVVGDKVACGFCNDLYVIGDPDIKLKKDQLLAELLILEEKIKPLLNGGVDTIRKIRELL